MDPVDKKYFLADMKNLAWKDIFEVFSRGIRLYIGKEPIETIPKGQAHYRKLQILHYIMLTIVYSFLAYITYEILKVYGWVDYAQQTYNEAALFVNNFSVSR